MGVAQADRRFLRMALAAARHGDDPGANRALAAMSDDGLERAYESLVALAGRVRVEREARAARSG